MLQTQIPQAELRDSSTFLPQLGTLRRERNHIFYFRPDIISIQISKCQIVDKVQLVFNIERTIHPDHPPQNTEAMNRLQKQGAACSFGK